jgi:hypothetical protein
MLRRSPKMLELHCFLRHSFCRHSDLQYAALVVVVVMVEALLMQPVAPTTSKLAVPTSSSLVGGLQCRRTPASQRGASSCAPHATAHPMDGRPWCESSAWGLPAPPEVTGFCSVHGWTSYFHDEGGPSAAVPHAYGIASPWRSPSLTYSPIRSSSPSYSAETPPYTPTPAEERGGRVRPLVPPGFEPRRTMAARSGVPPYYNNEKSSLATTLADYSELELTPPPPPLAPTSARPNTTAAANRRPGLRRPNMIFMGHIPNGRPLCNPPRSGEGEA